MPSCCVPNCRSGYPSRIKELKEQGKKCPSMFKIKEKDLQAYNRAIPRADRKLTTKDFVCSDHYHENDIVRYHEDLVIGELVIKGEPLKAPHLKEGALPSIFCGPSYLSKPFKEKRKAPKERQPVTKIPKHNEQVQVDGAEENLPDVPPEPPSSFVDPATVTLPKGWAVSKHDALHHYVKIDMSCKITHAVTVKLDKSVTTLIGRNQVQLKEFTLKNISYTAEKADDISAIIRKLNDMDPCSGDGFGHFAGSCNVAILKGIRCENCKKMRKNEQKKIRKALKKSTEMRKKESVARSKRLYKLRSQNLKLKLQVKTIKSELLSAYKKCKKLEKGQVVEAIKQLPEVQQQAVLACLAAAKKKGPKGNRYSQEWIYEALLMRIKSPRLYEHIRAKNILVLPSRTTINRYMRKLHPTFGFQPQLFTVVKEKVASYHEGAKHGSLLIDEMKITEGVTFDRHTLKTWGLVDLGKHTPEGQRNQVGDHILEVIYQPFQGAWYQSLGCFVSKGNAQGDILAKIVLEGITLCENAGLYVDAVVTDGASWNRNMWVKFGINEDSSSCEHPVDENRQLWFLSDWCHLVKCVRNNICPIIPSKKKRVSKIKNNTTVDTTDENENEENFDGPDDDNESNMSHKKHKNLETDAEFQKRKDAALLKEIETPDGTVKRRHWTALYEAESLMRSRYGVAAITYVPNFTKKHVFPSGFERMNVGLAYKFFSNSVAAGMEMYRKKGTVDSLKDSEPTEQFIRKFNDLADSMNSSNPAGAYRKDSKHESIINEYIEYHKECVALAKQNGKKAFVSEATDLGLLVTLKATAELCTYLIADCGFQYVMTARFNQDAVEQFFSNIRSALGPNTHPTAKMFAQVHRLLALYSLVQPPKGSNVSGVGNLKSLISAEDLIAESERERHEVINNILDEVVTSGEATDSLPPVCQIDHAYFPAAPEMEDSLIKFMAGFTASRLQKVAENCENCLLTFSQFREEAGPSHDFVKIKEMYGGYSYASNELCNLIADAEQAVQKCFKYNEVHEDMFITTLKYMKLPQHHLVGCFEHKNKVTKKMIKFYVTMRMFFVADRKSQLMEQKKSLQKQYSKRAKLM